MPFDLSRHTSRLMLSILTPDNHDDITASYAEFVEGKGSLQSTLQQQLQERMINAIQNIHTQAN
ncbi:MAG: hypothetical protein WA354_16930 [Terracidiphilus sp.]